MNSATMIPVTSPGSVTPPRRGRGPRRLAWLTLLLAALLVSALFAMSGDLLSVPLEITVNGATVASGLDLAALPAPHKLAVAVVVAVAVLVALLFTLAVLVVVAATLVPVLLLTVGLPVLVAGLVLLALFSPLLLLAWGLWRALKPARPATIAA